MRGKKINDIIIFNKLLWFDEDFDLNLGLNVISIRSANKYWNYSLHRFIVTENKKNMYKNVFIQFYRKLINE